MRSHIYLFLVANPATVAKLISFSTECLALRLLFEEGLGRLMHLSSPSEAFEFRELKKIDVSSTAKELTSGCSVCNGEI
jgi:hypothetical protein